MSAIKHDVPLEHPTLGAVAGRRTEGDAGIRANRGWCGPRPYRQLSVDLALRAADLLDVVEATDAENPDDPELPGARDLARTALAELREALSESAAIEAEIKQARAQTPHPADCGSD